MKASETPYARTLARFWLLAVAVAAVKFTWGVAYVSTRDERSLSQFVPDDGYYYLELARSFAETGVWSFDGGESRTSGFHLLFAYVLAGVHRIAPVLDGQTGVLVAVGLSVVALAAFGRLVWLERRWPFIAVLALIVSSPIVIRSAHSVIEWPLVVLFAVLVTLLVRQAPERLGLLFLAGLGGSLSRSDFGLLPACLFAGAAFVAWRRQEHVWLKPTFVALAGAAAGVGVQLIHNYVLTGQIFQSSSMMKAHWSAVQGHSPVPFLNVLRLLQYAPKDLVFEVFGSIPRAVAFLGVSCAALLAYVVRTKPWRAPIASRDLLMIVGSMLTLVGYGVFYTHNAAEMQFWYTANLAVPFFLLLALVASRMPTPLAVALLVVAFGLNLSASVTKPPYPYQHLLYDGGQLLRLPELAGARVGAWNAGIIGFHRGGGVINLDGLVNDDIYAHAKAQTLARYVREKRLTHIIDFPLSLSEINRRRGGYADGELVAALREVTRLESPAAEPPFEALVLWEVRWPDGVVPDRAPDPAAPAAGDGR